MSKLTDAKAVAALIPDGSTVAVFTLGKQGLELTEIAPGVELERDVLAHTDFLPIVKNVKPMDSRLFEARWGGVAEAMDNSLRS